MTQFTEKLTSAATDSEFKNFKVPLVLEASFKLFNSFTKIENIDEQFIQYVAWLLSGDHAKYYLQEISYIEKITPSLTKIYKKFPSEKEYALNHLQYAVWKTNEEWMQNTYDLATDAGCAAYLNWFYTELSTNKNFYYFESELDFLTQPSSLTIDNDIFFPHFLHLYWISVRHLDQYKFIDVPNNLENQLDIAWIYFFNVSLTTKIFNPQLIAFLNRTVTYNDKKMKYISLLCKRLGGHQGHTEITQATNDSDTIKYFIEKNGKQFAFQPELLKLFNEIINNSNNFELSPINYFANINSGLNLSSQSQKVPDSNLLSVVGFPRAELGLGEVTRTTLFSLQSNGVNADCVSIESNLTQHPCKDARVAKYLTERSNSDINIFVSTPAHIGSCIFDYGSDLFNDKYNIGIPFWEFSNWSKKYSFCFDFLDEVWAPTLFLKECYSAITAKPVIHMPIAVNCDGVANLNRSFFKLPEDKFLFMFMFDFNSSIHRKNPFATVKAFLKAFPKTNTNVGLVIKTMYPQQQSQEWNDFINLISADSRIYLINQVYSRPELLALMNVCDSFVSLHKSEGFGLGIAESMLLKKPTIATGYSGNMDFCSNETSLLVDYNMVTVPSGQYSYADGFKWAEASIDHASQQMAHCYEYGEEVKSKVNKAYSLIKTKFSEEYVGKIYKQRIQEIRSFLKN